MTKVQSSATIIKKALHLKRLGEDFTLSKINNSFRLKSAYFGELTSSSERKIPAIELGYIRRVRNYIMKNYIYENFITNLYYPKDIHYVSVNKLPPETIIEDVIEIDINEAYHRTAFLLNVISKELYEEGSKETGKISKLGRLIAHGSLAKKEDQYRFEGGRLRKETVRSVLTENIWYSICKRVSDLMQEAKELAGEDFILYWVDGIYVRNKPELVKKIIDLFATFDYDIKTLDNLTVKYTDDQIFVTDNNKETTRPFFIPKTTVKKPHFSDKQLREVTLEYSKYGVIEPINKENNE